MATLLSDDDDQFDFEMEERIEAAKAAVLVDLKSRCLEVAVR
jgi:hypothetical protein